MAEEVVRAGIRQKNPRYMSMLLTNVLGEMRLKNALEHLGMPRVYTNLAYPH